VCIVSPFIVRHVVGMHVTWPLHPPCSTRACGPYNSIRSKGFVSDRIGTRAEFCQSYSCRFQLYVLLCSTVLIEQQMVQGVTGVRDVGGTGCKSSSRYTGILIWLILGSFDGV
jgi:hypothetical protein